jgi:hypothetical protein
MIYLGGKFVSAYGFRGFSPWLVGPVAFELVIRYHIMAECVWQRKPLLSWKQRSKKERKGQGQGSISSLKPFLPQ